MTNSATPSRCPCNSGLDYTHCCGTPNRTAQNAEIMASIAFDGKLNRGHLLPAVEQALNSFTTCPDLFPARINFPEDKAYLVKMSPQWYSESVFLDAARIRGTCVIETELQWLYTIGELTPWQSSSLIFHTAFCGSTIMAHALEAMFNCLPLREPEALGNVLFHTKSQAIKPQSDSTWLDLVMRLLSRRYTPQQNVVIKANDYANPLISHLLQWRNDVPILFMYTPLREFLAGCLKAENRRDWIRARYQAIKAHIPDLFHGAGTLSLHEDAYGEMAAVYWSYNMAHYYRARQHISPLLRSLDFNRMLEHPLETVQSCGRLFGLSPLPDVDPATEIGNLFGVYSKNKNFTYSPQQRYNDIRRVLASEPTHLEAAEHLAKKLLKEKYPENGLPGNLLSH